ncbi:MAG: ATP-binding protein [Microscillaceae bacterium]|nr:ATP-binding protein [Microscillaceae bacterium]
MKKSQSLEVNPILRSIEKIANLFKDSELNEQTKRKLLAEVKEDVKIVGSFLHTTEDETWLFSIMFAMSICGKETDLDSLTHYLGCNPFFIVGLSPVLEGLVSKRLLIRSSGYDMKVIATRFHVSSFIFNAISLNKSIPKTNKFDDVYQLIERINEMICEREKNSLTTENLFNEVMDLLERESHFAMIKKIMNLRFTEDDTLLLMYLCYSYANDSNEADIERYVYYVYDSIGNKIRAKKNLFSGQSRLLEEDWVCFVEDSFYGGKELALTDKAIDLLFSEDLGVIEKNKSFNPKNCILITPDKIKAPNLYFNEQEQKQIDLLSQLLEEENFRKAKEKFAKLGFASGITGLFYGEPGTGKTQVAYNLAKQTGRVILMVDIASVRDKFVGESEKRIKQIFRTYKQAQEYYDFCPILFFNESDALISKRFEVSSSVDQMNNSMQNILLQELEDFEGILIATSNMSLNLDAAFERRFLYKIHFEKPEPAIRYHIWQEKMPELPAADLKVLADDYELSGGQIHNISRKYWLNNVLNEREPNLKEIAELCENEFFNKRKTGNLGFRNSK